MTVQRWTFSDGTETYTVPINPNEMSDPTGKQRALESGLVTTIERPPAIVEWTFNGVIHRKSHHDELLRWSKKQTLVQITDHLGRTFAVVMKAFDPKERRPTPDKPWRFTYTMTTQVLRRVS